MLRDRRGPAAERPTSGLQIALGSKRVREAQCQELALDSPVALDFGVYSVAYRLNPFVKMSEGHGPVRSAKTLTQEAIVHSSDAS